VLDCRSSFREFKSHLDLSLMCFLWLLSIERTMPQQQGRDVLISPEHVDKVWLVHSGRTWMKIRPSAEMVSLKFGERVKTRRSRPYTKKAVVRGKKR
jgi:ribosomal protein S19